MNFQISVTEQCGTPINKVSDCQKSETIFPRQATYRVGAAVKAFISSLQCISNKNVASKTIWNSRAQKYQKTVGALLIFW